MESAALLLFLLACLLLPAAAADLSEPKYTEDVEVYKKDNVRGRMELLLGCWLLSREYSNSTEELYQLALIKACMKTITRKDSVVKITSLIGKNMTTPKTYAQIVTHDNIPAGSVEGGPTDFDRMLLQYVRGYEKDIEGIQKGKEGDDLKKKVEEEITKRQKYYFGIFPVNEFTHTVALVLLSILMVAVCTCWKSYTRKNQKKNEQEQAGSYFKDHDHEHCPGQKCSFTKSPKPKKA